MFTLGITSYNYKNQPFTAGSKTCMFTVVLSRIIPSAITITDNVNFVM